MCQSDQTYAALLTGVSAATLARENPAVTLAFTTPQGDFACIATSRDTWVDRIEPPLSSLIAWQLDLRSGERSILEQCDPAVARNQRWQREMRDPDGSGLISCGSSDIGAALYKGTAFGAHNDTGMDNSATSDEAVCDPAIRRLSTWNLGLNCVVALDPEMLALKAVSEVVDFDRWRGLTLRTLAARQRSVRSCHLMDSCASQSGAATLAWLWTAGR